MVAHDALSTAGFHHVVHQMQGFANARPAIDYVAQKQCLTLWVPPDTLLSGIPHVFKQSLQRVRTPMDIADDIVTPATVQSILNHWSVSLLLQPSLLRQMA